MIFTFDFLFNLLLSNITAKPAFIHSFILHINFQNFQELPIHYCPRFPQWFELWLTDTKRVIGRGWKVGIILLSDANMLNVAREIMKTIQGALWNGMISQFFKKLDSLLRNLYTVKIYFDCGILRISVLS